jgi:hypothetical protein
LHWGNKIRIVPLCVAVGLLTAGNMAFGQKPDASGKVSNTSQSPASFQLKLGSIEKPSGRVATLPVIYSANKSKGSSNIRAEVSVPGSSWIFQAAEPPKGAWWKVTSKEHEGARGSALELTLQGDGRLLPEGVLAYLQFRLEPAGAAMPAGMTIKAIEGSSTSTGPRRISGTQGNSSDIPDSPPVNPSPGCFFFSH